MFQAGTGENQQEPDGRQVTSSASKPLVLGWRTDSCVHGDGARSITSRTPQPSTSALQIMVTSGLMGLRSSPDSGRDGPLSKDFHNPDNPVEKIHFTFAESHSILCLPTSIPTLGHNGL